MQHVLMCRPTHFDVTYDINPWMSNQIGQVDKISALAQWFLLMDKVSRVAVVNVLDGVKDKPDLVFTANAGFIHNQTAILSKFSKPERQPEEQEFRTWFESKGYTVVQPTVDYEGEGDHLVDSQGRHWVGTGFRTSKQVKSELEDFLNQKVNTLELIDPRWYHLDTCFCPLPDGGLMWYPKAFTRESQSLISQSFKHGVEVMEEDALAFACNAVCIGKDIFLPENRYASSSLKKLGYVTHEVPLTEFLKAGGAAKCLVLHLGEK